MWLPLACLSCPSISVGKVLLSGRRWSLKCRNQSCIYWSINQYNSHTMNLILESGTNCLLYVGGKTVNANITYFEPKIGLIFTFIYHNGRIESNNNNVMSNSNEQNTPQYLVVWQFLSLSKRRNNQEALTKQRHRPAPSFTYNRSVLVLKRRLWTIGGDSCVCLGQQQILPLSSLSFLSPPFPSSLPFFSLLPSPSLRSRPH